MHGVERQVDKPGFCVVSLNETYRLAPECVCGVVDGLHRGGAAQDGISRIACGIEVIVRPAQEAEILVKSALQRVELRLIAQVRLPEPSRPVARLFQVVANRLLL